MSFNDIKSILESGLLVKLTREEIQFLSDNINDESANMPPDSYNVYGRKIGSGNSSPFRFYNPIIEPTSTGGNKIVGFSWKPFAESELPGTSGTSKQKNRSPINEETTSKVIDLAKKGEISKREAIAIIRARVGLEQGDFPYKIPKEPYKDEDLQRPQVFGVKYGSGTYPGTNFNGSMEQGQTDLKSHITSINRSYSHKTTINDFYNTLQKNVSSGKWKVTFCLSGKMIVYELVDNPYLSQHKLGTSSSDSDLNTVPDQMENTQDRSDNPRWVPSKIKRPVRFDFTGFNSLTDEQKGLDSFYLDILNSGRNINGEKLPTSPSDIANENFQKLFTSGPEHHSYGTIGDAVYGSKNYVYGGAFAIVFGSALLRKYGERVPFVRTILSKAMPGGFGLEMLTNFLTKAELKLVDFKLFKDIATEDALRFVRDYGLSKLSHHIEHVLGPRAIIGGRSFLAGIPWVGWTIAAVAISWDLFLGDYVSQKIDDANTRDRYKEALRSQTRKNTDTGINFNWKLLRPGQSIDPGIAIFDPECIVPIQIDENGENADPPIGIETDKDGNPKIDPKTKLPILKFPKRRKHQPSTPGIQYYQPSDEIGIQENIESENIKDKLADNAESHRKSDEDYMPQSSIALPIQDQPQSYDGTNEYTLGKDDDLRNPFPDEIIDQPDPNGLPRNLITEFFVVQPERPLYYIYGERLIYPSGGPSGQSSNAAPPNSSATIDSSAMGG
jgi:hypothetical protein